MVGERKSVFRKKKRKKNSFVPEHTCKVGGVRVSIVCILCFTLFKLVKMNKLQGVQPAEATLNHVSLLKGFVAVFRTFLEHLKH